MSRTSNNPVGSDLDLRSQDILHEIVRNFIESGEPVGSRTLSKISKHRVSPATIRNVMSDLEEAGYLYQPHTSAGRIPTDLGYRYFVNRMTDFGSLGHAEQDAVQKTLANRFELLEEILVSTSRLLSKLTANVGFAVLPEFSATIFHHIEFVRLGEKKILVILVSKSGAVQHRAISVEQDLAQSDLDQSARYLVDEFQGLTLPKIRSELLQLMSEEKAQYDRLLKRSIDLGQKSFTKEDSSGQVFVEGASNLFDKPEFADIRKMKGLFQTFERKNRLVEILTECLETSDGVQIVIGSEHPNADMQGCSLITSPYEYEDRTIGTIGVVGPTRMEYAKTIQAVGYVARAVSEALSRREP